MTIHVDCIPYVPRRRLTCPTMRLLTSALLLATVVSQSYAELWGGDITNNGNYLIARCRKDKTSGKAHQLMSLLQEIGGDLPAIVTEANTGFDSPYGFTSLFTSNDAIPDVTANFARLSNAENVTINGNLRQITFVCLEPGDPITASTFHYALTTQPRGVAFNEFGSELIYLTPLFFDGMMRNPAPYRCPIFRRNRVVVNWDDILGATQYGTIIHELVDKYLHPDDLDFQEKYDLRDCIRLSEDQQLINAENYNLFASCELHQNVRWWLADCGNSDQSRMHWVSENVAANDKV